MKYQYRITSKLAGCNLEPSTMTITLSGAIDVAKEHAEELPGCETTIEERDGAGWKEWATGNWAPENGGNEDTMHFDDVYADSRR